MRVAPLVGAWIEIFYTMGIRAEMAVAPLVGAWIEIHENIFGICTGFVAPLVGAWIEINDDISLSVFRVSLPSWERGLKSYLYISICHAGICRSPRGSVD